MTNTKHIQPLTQKPLIKDNSETLHKTTQPVGDIDELKAKIYAILHDDIELRTDNGQPYLGITDIAEDNIVGLIAAQNLALLTRLEAAFDVEYQMICRENGVTRPTPHTAFHSIIQSERALIEKRMM